MIPTTLSSPAATRRSFETPLPDSAHEHSADASAPRAPALRRELTWFIAITFIATYAIAGLAAARGGLGAFPAIPLAMLTPMLTALGVQRFIAKRPIIGENGLGFRWGSTRYWLAAPAVMILLWAVVFGVSYFVHPAAYANWDAITANVRHLKNVPGSGQSAVGTLVSAYALTIFVAPLLNLPIFLGEEVGWRGFMTPRLVALFGRRGLLVSGVVWALWHTPFIFLGLDYPTHPMVGHLLWIPFCICFGIILQTLYVRSGSIFPVALAHGITNQVCALTLGIVLVDAQYSDLLDGPAGVVALVILVIPAVYCYRRFPIHDAGNREQAGARLR
jgi:membrane protease YdiL (CAAX protease family)